ncbi:hypothetical protein [Streptomyces sp. NPDC003077]|uniref:hypothetical protein n=1 Tax=Streptomyces sp. NPDC003077 TaxID=3154443 RepID=UPI0033A55FA1
MVNDPRGSFAAAVEGRPGEPDSAGGRLAAPVGSGVPAEGAPGDAADDSGDAGEDDSGDADEGAPGDAAEGDPGEADEAAPSLPVAPGEEAFLPDSRWASLWCSFLNSFLSLSESFRASLASLSDSLPASPVSRPGAPPPLCPPGLFPSCAEAPSFLKVPCFWSLACVPFPWDGPSPGGEKVIFLPFSEGSLSPLGAEPPVPENGQPTPPEPDGWGVARAADPVRGSRPRATAGSTAVRTELRRIGPSFE